MSIDNPLSNGRRSRAHKTFESRCRAHAQIPPAGDARARLPFFCRDLLHHVDLEVTLGDELLELRVLLLELAQSLHVDRFQLTVPLAPAVDRRLAHAVLLREIGDR